MRVRLYNARILSMVDSEVSNGEVWIKDCAIEYVGVAVDVSCEEFDREIDLKRKLIMPGFKNAHAHSAMTFARGYADGYPLDVWLNQKIFPMEAKLKSEHVHCFSKLAYMEYLSSGITANFDMYYEPDAIIRASTESGMKTVLCGAVNNFKESVDILESYFQEYNHTSELISYVLGFHAEYTTDLKIIEGIGKLAEKYEAPVFVHNSETQKEVQECIERYGITPTALFERSGIYQYGGGGFHCTHLTDDDVDIFRKRDLSIVINTCSNLKLASGVAPVFDYNKAGIRLALGTDGASSNNALDMFREMYITAVLQKVIKNDPVAIDAFDILKMATVNGASAMGLNNCTTIEVGKAADLIVIDLSMPNLSPENDLINNLVYSGGKQNVYMTMINGKILYEDGEYKTIDKEEILYYANKYLKELKC